MGNINTEMQDGSATFKIRSITELVKNLEDLQTKNTQLVNQLAELTTIQQVNISFDSTYVDYAYAFKVGHIVMGYCSFRKSGEDPHLPIITNLPKAAFSWGAVVTPLNANSHGGLLIRVHMDADTTVLNLHYSTRWEMTQGNEAELTFAYITTD